MKNPDQQFSDYFDGQMSGAEFEALCASLQDDADLASEFAKYSMMEGHLREQLSFEAGGIDGFVGDKADSLTVSDSQTQVALRPKSWLDRASRRPKGPSITVAAVVLVAVIVAMAVTPMKQWIAGDDPADEQSVAAEFVAKLTNWRSDVWLEASRPPKRDPRLAIGSRLVLRSGFVTLEYETGTHVILEGPAEYEVRGVNSGYLGRGKLVARIETEEAKHFKVETPVTFVEDLGTEFALAVASDGRTDLHVYEGKVQMGGTNGLAAQVVGAGVSYRIASDTSGDVSAEPVGSLDKSFVRSFAALGFDQAGTAAQPYVIRPKWDSYVSRHEPNEIYLDSDTLLVKRDAGDRHWDREAWLAFDLAGIDVEQLSAAQLALTIARGIAPPTKKANPDDEWQFEVLGLWEDEIGIDDSRDLTWNNSRNAAARPIATLRFAGDAPAGRQVGTDGAGLFEFLREAQGRTAVLIIRRMTDDQPTRVNGFASMERGNVGPLLRLQYGADSEPPSK